MATADAIRTWLRTTVHDLVVVPVVAALSARLDRMEIKMAGSWDDAFARFAQVQADGFGVVRKHITDAVRDAQASGDQAGAERLARLDAGIDSLAAGFAQFSAAAPVDTPDSLPPVVNPDTPAPAETVPDVASELPVDPQTVVDDPQVPTPQDEG